MFTWACCCTVGISNLAEFLLAAIKSHCNHATRHNPTPHIKGSAEHYWVESIEGILRTLRNSLAFQICSCPFFNPEKSHLVQSMGFLVLCVNGEE